MKTSARERKEEYERLLARSAITKDPNTRMVLEVLADSFRPRHLPKRGLDKELVGRALVTSLQEVVGNKVQAATDKIRAVGVKIEKHQVEKYFSGSHTPQRSVIVRIANAFQLPELRELADHPWGLLSLARLTLGDIEAITAPTQKDRSFVLKNEVDKKELKRGQSRWHRPLGFDPRYYWVAPPGDPQEFWQSIASYRAAEAMRDYESMNAHRWLAVTRIASVATIPAVAANAELLYRCMAQLTRRTEKLHVWFSVDWPLVQAVIDAKTFGVRENMSPFDNVFTGTFGDTLPKTKR